MTSNINPNNINGAYPVAGQDNNSQGFRTNFTNTSTNFQYAADEITDLQNKVILSAQLSGGNSLAVQNNLQNSPLTNALISDFATPAIVLGTLSGTVTIDYTQGHYQTVTTGAPISLAFINWPIAGQAGSVTVEITVTDPTFTVTLPAAVSVNANGIQGLDTTTNTMTFAAANTYRFEFISYDNGTTITISNPNTQLQPFNASYENFVTGNAISLATTTSFLAGAGTGTLASGVLGQTKTLVQTVTGSMVITAAATIWNSGNAGNITLNTVGTACSLQCDGTNWYCIGNNGATFS